jgi:Holliday junction resolvase-like predicted endonuclease
MKQITINTILRSNQPKNGGDACMNGHDYEYAVAKHLQRIGYTGVKVTKGSGDFGVDIIAHKGIHKYAVQCKYYSNPVGVAAVQEVVAGKAYYKCDKAIVVTNNTFTKPASKLAKANDVILLDRVNATMPYFSGPYKSIKIAYLIFTLAAVYMEFRNAKALPFWTGVHNIICTTFIMSIPFWILPAIKAICRTCINALKHHISGRKSSKKVVVDISEKYGTCTTDESSVRYVLSLIDERYLDSNLTVFLNEQCINLECVKKDLETDYEQAAHIIDALSDHCLISFISEDYYIWLKHYTSHKYKIKM